MNSKQKPARPLFRILAAIVAVVGLILAIASLVTGQDGYFVGASVFLLFGGVAASGFAWKWNGS